MQCLKVHSEQKGLNKFQKSTDDDLRKLPPSREALLQHTKRACYQAGYLWQECESDLDHPDPKLWGWTFNEDHGLIPCWLTATSPIDLDKFMMAKKNRNKVL